MSRGADAPRRGGYVVSAEDAVAEHRRFAEVVREIRGRLAAAGRARARRSEELVELRRDFWDDFKLQADASDARAEAQQEHVVLAHKQRQYDRAAAELALLARLAQAPYFGRVDFVADDAADAEAVYVGLCSLRAADGTQLVYDWRAPIAGLYYDAVPGRVAYDAPVGPVRGRMDRKRQFVVRQGVLEAIIDSDLTIGDALLMQALSRRGDAAMRSIVSTIQAEQNRAIRDLVHPLVVVLGAAGSGKTSVALQRVAFLLYRYRDSLDADQIVLFSPNPLFASFVSTVLPELGERNMRQVTFQEYLERRFAGELQVESPFDQLESLLTAAETPALAARRRAIAFKASAAFLLAIQRYADRLGRAGMVFVPLVFRDRVVVSAAEIGREFAAAIGGASVAARVQRVREGLRRRLDRLAAEEARAAWPEDELELLDVEARQEAYEHLAGRDDALTGAEYYRRERALMTQAVVERHLAALRQWVEEMRFLDTRALYLSLLSDAALLGEQGGAPPGWENALAETRRALERGELPYEDATPLLYLTELVRGRHTSTLVRHVLVDEAQDYSHCQLDFLRRVFPYARMTLLGDPSQAVHSGGAALADLGAIAARYGQGEVAVLHLDRSYRPTREIVAFTCGLLADGREVVPFDRPGRKPRLTVVPDPAGLASATQAAVRALRQDGCATLAVICKTAEEARRVADALPAELDGRLVTKASVTLEPGIAVMPGYLAKGLEFDGVVVYDASRSRYATEDDRGLLYAASTRAMHDLWLVAAQSPSPFVQAAAPDTYTLVG